MEKLVTDWKKLSKQSSQIPPTIKFDIEDEVYDEEIGDGNLNDVVRLYTKHADGQIKKSIIVKHAPPYIKLLGEGFPLTEERIVLEFKALSKFHEVSPGSVPHPYLLDHALSSAFMEDLNGYSILRKELMEGKLNMQIIENIAKHLANVHLHTHVSKLDPDKFAQMCQEFKNPDMNSITEQYVFTRPFNSDDPTNKYPDGLKDRLGMVHDDKEVCGTVKRMLKLFSDKKECLLHGDLHTGSILVKGTDARLFDIEFASVGPAAFDVGMFLANLIQSYYRHMSIEEEHDRHREFTQMMIDASKVFVRVYLEHMTVYRDEKVAEFMEDVTGFAGTEVIRRLLGAAHTADLEGRSLAQQDCLASGVRLMKAVNRIHDIDRFLVIAFMLI